MEEDDERDETNPTIYKEQASKSNPLITDKGDVKSQEKLGFLLDLCNKLDEQDFIRKLKSGWHSTEGLEYNRKLKLNSVQYGIIWTKDPRDREHRLIMSPVPKKCLKALKNGKIFLLHLVKKRKDIFT
jgi:hypothetical protein